MSDDERWLISYADMVTLLFALFVALYALGIQDKAKASMLSASIQEALDRPLSQKVIFQPPSVVVPTNAPRVPRSQSFLNAKDRCLGGPGSGGSRDPAAQEEMRRMKEDLDKLSEDPELEGKLDVEQLNEREVLVRLTSAGFFDPGGNEPNEDAFRTLEALARRLKQYKAVETRVEGHTDNIPITGGRYPSNWELSSARASAVVRALVSRSGMDPTRMTAVGYGEFRPIADNETIQGRKANRRIDILVRQPPNAKEKAWIKGQSSSGSSSSGGKGAGKDGKGLDPQIKGAGSDPLDPSQFMESFGLHSDLNETGKPPPTRSPPTRQAPVSLSTSEVTSMKKSSESGDDSGGH